jgi:hypothetical protein
MGSFSIWHWIVVLLFFVIPACIGLVIWLIARAVKRPSSVPELTFPPDSKRVTISSAEARLQELSSLRSKGLITDSEFEQQRSAILRSV